MSSRAYPFPVLEKQENSNVLRYARPPYQSSAGYYFAEAEFDGGGPAATISITHHLGGSNLVVDLLEQGLTSFAITVSAPETMFRKIFVDDRRPVQSEGGEFVLLQPIELNKADFTGTVFVRGSVLVTQNVPVVVESGHGLRNELLGCSFELPRGTVIATEAMHAFGIGTLSALLALRKDKKLKDGQIRVESDETSGYRFILYVGQRLHKQMRTAGRPAEHAHVRSICTHALSRGLQLLRDDIREDSEWWTSFSSLRWLAARIASCKLPRWDQDGFCSEVAATAIREHCIVTSSEQE